MDTDRLDIVTKLEWAIDTIKSQLLFGRDDLGAAKARELRAKGVMLDAIDHIKQLEQKLSDSEADWIKMRDIAEETQRKLVKLATMVVCNEQYDFSETYDVARDFLANIENKKD